MEQATTHVTRKQLAFLEGLVVHRSFRLDKVEIPPLLSRNEKHLTIDFIIVVSTMARLMKCQELTAEAERVLGLAHPQKHEMYYLIALLMAAGVREYSWKEEAVRALIKLKKDKLVKEGISEWWRGKTPETGQENRIA